MIELKLSRLELDIVHNALRFHINRVPSGKVAKELARRIHSLKSDYDTEVKLGIETSNQPE